MIIAEDLREASIFEPKKMSRFFLFSVLLLLTLQSCDSEKTAVLDEISSIQKDFNSILNDYTKKRKELYPLESTAAGEDIYNDVLPNNLTASYTKRLVAFYEDNLQRLSRIDRAQLNDKEKMSYDVLMWESEINIADLGFPKNLMPIDQMWTMNLIIGQLASGAGSQPFNTVKDYRNWLKRMYSYELWCMTAMDNMREGMKTGVVLPKALVKKIIPQMKDLSDGPVEKHLFYKPVLNLPESFTEAEKEEITTAYKDVIENSIIPVYKKFTKQFEKEYMPLARTTSGIDAMPNGTDWYNHQIKKFTTTNMTADEIFKLGEKEVARLRSEMEKVKKQVGYTGDLNSFFDHVRNKKELMPFKTAEEVIANFNAIHEKMKPNLAKLFDLVPKTKFEVRRTEAFREASASAEYSPGSLDGTRPGVFYVPLPDPSKYNTFSDEDLFLHEAIPGHHYQISLQQEDKDLPEFRRTLWYSAYGEGWALYCESLGKELGLYQDPYQYFGMLSMEMHRAIRLVVDAGMHSKGWTREQAIKYSLENEAEPEASIISEIERYMANPGQALSYKIGQLKIQELRSRAEKQMGDKFDIKTFHNKVLEVGCVPLALLERRIEEWIAE